LRIKAVLFLEEKQSKATFLLGNILAVF